MASKCEVHALMVLIMVKIKRDVPVPQFLRNQCLLSMSSLSHKSMKSPLIFSLPWYRHDCIYCAWSLDWILNMCCQSLRACISSATLATSGTCRSLPPQCGHSSSCRPADRSACEDCVHVNLANSTYCVTITG